MNYITQLNGFFDSAALNPISTSAQLLYLHLLNINNRRNWCKDFTVPNINVQAVTGLSRSQLDKARNELKQKGYIEYQKGAGSASGRYLIVELETQAQTQRKAQTAHNAGNGGAQTGRSYIKQKNNNTHADTREKRAFGEFQNVMLGDDDLSKLDEYGRDVVCAAIEWLSQYKAENPQKQFYNDYSSLKRFGIPAVLERQSRLKSETREAFTPRKTHVPSAQPQKLQRHEGEEPGARERRAVAEMREYCEQRGSGSDC